MRNYISGSENRDDEANSIAIQGDGKIVVGGSSRNTLGNPQFAIARYNTDGTLDSGFGVNGSASNPICPWSPSTTPGGTIGATRMR